MTCLKSSKFRKDEKRVVKENSRKVGVSCKRKYGIGLSENSLQKQVADRIRGKLDKINILWYLITPLYTWHSKPVLGNFSFPSSRLNKINTY